MKQCKKCNQIKSLNDFYKKGKKYYREICKECSKKSLKIYGLKWDKNNKDWYIKYRKEYRTRKYVKIKQRLRHRIWTVLKNKTKSASTIELIGCNIENLISRLESKFKEGMTWKNYGKWEIDHIKPCSSFDLTKSEEQRKCFNYKNLQPLWQSENRKKYNKLNSEV